MVTAQGGEEGVHLHFTHFLSFHSSASEVSLLCYIESQKEDWRENLFFFSFLKAAHSLWAIEASNA